MRLLGPNTEQLQKQAQQFEQDIQQHLPLLHKVCNIYAYTLHDRQDLFQDIVVQLWKAYPNYRGDARMSTFMYRVAINTAITVLRKKDNRTYSYEPALLPQAADGGLQDPEAEKLALLHKAIAELNEVERAIVMLYLEDKTYEEMEQILGIQQSTLRVKMNRIREKLRQLTKTK